MSVGIVDKQTGDRIPTAGMPAIDNALDLTSSNPVQNAVITAALADKQDKSDNNLQTTDKTVVGAVNELKSGLTNYEATTNAALSVPENSGKNVLPLTLANLKSVNTTGTWADNVYTLNDVDFTVNIDSNGRVSGITANGTASANTNFFFVRNSPNIYSGYILNGSVGGNSNSYYIALSLNSSPWTTNTCYNSDTIITIPKTATIESYIRIANGYEANNVTFQPMIRPATITDPTFAPYIPSVESRIEAVESARFRVLASSSKTGTHSAKLDELTAIYDTLTSMERMHAIIHFNSYILQIADIYNNRFATTAKYVSSDKLVSYHVQLGTTGSTLFKSVTDTTGTTFTDMSAETDANLSIQLLI